MQLQWRLKKYWNETKTQLDFHVYFWIYFIVTFIINIDLKLFNVIPVNIVFCFTISGYYINRSVLFFLLHVIVVQLLFSAESAHTAFDRVE